MVFLKFRLLKLAAAAAEVVLRDLEQIGPLAVLPHRLLKFGSAAEEAEVAPIKPPLALQPQAAVEALQMLEGVSITPRDCLLLQSATLAVAVAQQVALVAREALLHQAEPQDKQAFFTTAAMAVLALQILLEALAVVEQANMEAAVALLDQALRPLEGAVALGTILGQFRSLQAIAKASETASRPTRLS